MHKVRALIQTFKERLTASHVCDVEHQPTHFTLRWLTQVLIIVVLSALPIYQIYMYQPVELQMNVYSEPVIRLTETETSPELVDQINSNEGKVSFENTYYQKWNPFIAKHYQFREYARFTKIISDGEVYAPRVSTNFYRLSHKSMGRRLVDDLVDRYSITTDDSALSKVSNLNYDYLIVNEGLKLKQIFGMQGDRVVQVTYYGEADMELLLELTNYRMINDTF